MQDSKQQPPPFERRGRSKSPIGWMLTGVVLVLVAGLAIASAGGYFVYRTARNAGIDPGLMRRKPVFALTKLQVAKDPNLEILSADENADTVTVRDKNSSKVATYRYDLDKRSLVVVGDDLRSTAAADGASFEVKGPDGTMKFGAGSAPAWIPTYAGATLRGTASTTTAEGEQNTFTFKTTDSPGKVLAFYQDSLQANGFTVNMAMTGDRNGMVQGQADGGKRSVVITLGASSDGTEGSIVTFEKK
jgi:hypothetical protein